MQSRNISTSIYLFLFNDTPTTDIYTLSLHDALPIAESLYEVGWLQKPAGQGRASLPLTTAAERSEKTKALARSRFEQAQQALRQRDFATARKLIDEADQTEANQPATLNLRGEISKE